MNEITTFNALGGKNTGQKEFKNFHILKKNTKGQFEPYKQITEYDKNELINRLRDAQSNHANGVLFDGEFLQVNSISIEEIKDYQLTEKQFKYTSEELLVVVKDKIGHIGKYNGLNVFKRKTFLQDMTDCKIVDRKKVPKITELGVKYCVYNNGKREFINKEQIQWGLTNQE